MSERPPPLGTLLSAAGRRLGADLDTALGAAGFGDLRAAHASLFMAIDADGSTMTELAARTRMTKQAMGDLVRHLERHGYVDVRVDPVDRRARRVRLTGRGWNAVTAGLQVVIRFEAWLSDAIGSDQVEHLRTTLDRIIGADAATWTAETAETVETNDLPGPSGSPDPASG